METPHRVRIAAATCVGLAIASLGGTAFASTGSGPGDGNWMGFLRYDGSAEFATDDGAVRADYLGAGGFFVTVAGGRATGDYGFNVNTTLPDIDAAARGAGRGAVSGPIESMTLALENLTVTESTLGMSFPFSARELGDPEGVLVTTRSSCDMMNGTWNHEFGLSTDVSTDGIGGTWTAVRIQDPVDPDELREQMDELQSWGDDVLATFRDGSLDTGDLRDFLSFAESVAGELPRDECDRTSSDLHHLALAVVQSLLDDAAGYADELDLDELLELIRAGTRTGAFTTDADLRSAYESQLLFLASEAAAAGDTRTLNRLLAGALMAGWYSTATAIEEFLEEAR